MWATQNGYVEGLHRVDLQSEVIAKLQKEV